MNFECVMSLALRRPAASLLCSGSKRFTMCINQLVVLTHSLSIHLLLLRRNASIYFFLLFFVSSRLYFSEDNGKALKEKLEIITNVSQNDTLRDDIIAKLTQIFRQHCAMHFLPPLSSINIRLFAAALSRNENLLQVGKRDVRNARRVSAAQCPRDPIKFSSAISNVYYEATCILVLRVHFVTLSCFNEIETSDKVYGLLSLIFSIT